jgi:arginyl-tRNA synthetase
MSPELNETNLHLLNSTSELILIQHLAKYDEVVWQAYQEYEPYHIVQYLFQLVYVK